MTWPVVKSKSLSVFTCVCERSCVYNPLMVIGKIQNPIGRPQKNKQVKGALYANL